MADMIEVDKDMLEQLQMAYNLQKSLHDSDESREDYERALKKKFPEKYKTSSERAKPILAPIEQELKELREWKKSLENDRADNDLKATFDRLRKDSGYTDEGIKEIEKIMIDRKVADPEVAAAYFEKRNPPKPIESSGYGERGWNFGDNVDQKGSEAEGWFSDPNRMFDKIATEEFSKKKTA